MGFPRIDVMCGVTTEATTSEESLPFNDDTTFTYFETECWSCKYKSSKYKIPHLHDNQYINIINRNSGYKFK